MGQEAGLRGDRIAGVGTWGFMSGAAERGAMA